MYDFDDVRNDSYKCELEEKNISFADNIINLWFILKVEVSVNDKPVKILNEVMMGCCTRLEIHP